MLKSVENSGGKSQRELNDSRSGLQKWVLRRLHDLKADLTAQMHVQQNWSTYRTNMHLPLENLSDGLSGEQIEAIEETVEESLDLDNDHYLAITEMEYARFEKLANDPRLQNGSFPLETLVEVLRYTYRFRAGPDLFISGLESLQKQPEQPAFLLKTFLQY